MRAARAKGGKTTVFAGAGSPEMKEANSGDSGFKRGGRKHKGGHRARGGKAKARLDRAGRASGGSVTSTAGKQSPPSNSGSGQGKEGDGPSGTDPDRARGGRTGHWIQGAIRHPGSFRNAAQRAGMSTRAFAEKHKHSSGTIGRRARLALTLTRMHD